MKKTISEVIKELQWIKKEYGNLEVSFNHTSISSIWVELNFLWPDTRKVVIK